jgi:hypothetical protein
MFKYIFEKFSFFKFSKIQNWYICFTFNLQINFFLFFSINDLLQCVFLENVLQGIAINERVLMMWRKYSDGVPNVLIDNTNILSEGAGIAVLRLRRRFMRTSYVPQDVQESATNASSELNDSIRVLNFTCSDGDISEGNVSHTTDEDISSFTDDLSDSGPLTYIPSLTIVDEEEAMVEEYTGHDMLGEFIVSLSHNFSMLLRKTSNNLLQFKL